MLALSALENIDNQLITLLSDDTGLNVNEMARLLNERKQCLADISIHKDALETQYWSMAIERSQHIFNQIKKHRDCAAVEVGRLLKGRKSIEIYKKFE